MPVQYVPTGLEGLDFTRAGEAIGSLLFKDKIQEKHVQDFLLANPQAGAALATQFRSTLAKAQQQWANADPTVQGVAIAKALSDAGKAVGIKDPGTIRTIMDAHPPTPQELAINTPGYVEGAAKVITQEPKVAAQEQAARGAKAVSEQATAEADVKFNVPQLRAFAQATGAEAATAQGKQTVKSLKDYDNFITNLPPSQQHEATLALANPQFFTERNQQKRFDSSLAFQQKEFDETKWYHRQELDLQRMELDVRKASANAKDPLQMFNLMKSVDNEIDGQIKLLQKAQDDGKKDEVELRKANINKLAQVHSAYFPDQPVPIAADVAKTFGLRTGVELQVARPKAPEETAIDLIKNGNEEQLQKSEIWKSFSPEKQKDILGKGRTARAQFMASAPVSGAQATTVSGEAEPTQADQVVRIAGIKQRERELNASLTVNPPKINPATGLPDADDPRIREQQALQLENLSLQLQIFGGDINKATSVPKNSPYNINQRVK
jgi:hypothetical protein